MDNNKLGKITNRQSSSNSTNQKNPIKDKISSTKNKTSFSNKVVNKNSNNKRSISGLSNKNTKGGLFNKNNNSEDIDELENQKKQSFASKKTSEIKSNVETKIKKAIKNKLIIQIALPAILGAFLIFFIIELILGPLMEVWYSIDEKITKAADFSEKLENFYHGFGFQNSKEAFYDEIEDLQDRYGSQLDIPLLLSTIFYTEGMGYDTEFGLMEDGDVKDGSVSGSNIGIWNAIKDYLKDKFEESKQTVDENGLVYNVGKIYRLRKLARNQFHTDLFGNPSREGAVRDVSLSEFLEKYGKYIGGDIKRLLGDLLSPIGLVGDAVDELIAIIFGSSYKGNLFSNILEITEELKNVISDLIYDIFYGIADVVSCKFGFSGGKFTIVVSYRDFQFDETNYNSYLSDYYIESIPEFRDMLPSGEKARTLKKDQIIKEIYENKKLFEEIFLQYESGSVENYLPACEGAIDTKLVNQLRIPLDIDPNYKIDFGDSGFGMRTLNGTTRMHNGVDAGPGATGVPAGSPVYAVADGVVTNSLPDEDCNVQTKSSCATTGAWVRLYHEVVVDNVEYKFYTVYMHLQANSGQPPVGARVKKGDVIGRMGNTGSSYGAHLHFEFRDENKNAIDPQNIFIRCAQGGVFAGSNNEEAVWNYLLGLGYQKTAVAGIMGNMFVESWHTFDGRIVQGYTPNDDYTVSQSSIDYTNNVDSGKITKNDFVYHGPNGSGYGIVQWTYWSLKLGLYNYAKDERETSIGDTAMQIDYLKKYLEESGEDKIIKLNQKLKESNLTVEQATEEFMLKFENPKDQSSTAISNRQSYARQIYNRYAK